HARTLGGDLANDLLQVDQGSGETVHRCDNQLVPVPQVPNALFELYPISTRASRLLLDIDPVALPHRLELTRLVLIGGRHPHVRHPLPTRTRDPASWLRLRLRFPFDDVLRVRRLHPKVPTQLVPTTEPSPHAPAA